MKEKAKGVRGQKLKLEEVFICSLFAYKKFF